MDILLLTRMVSVLGASWLALAERLDPAISNLFFAIVCLTFNIKAARIAAFRFSVYALCCYLLFENDVSIEYQSYSLYSIFLLFSLIDVLFILISSRNYSPTKYIYLTSVTNMCITSIMLISFGYFPLTPYNIVNNLIPILLVGMITYEATTRIR